MDEEEAFQAELARIDPPEREQVMEIVTSWMEKGIEQGIEQGVKQGKQNEALSLVRRMLFKRLGPLEQGMEARVAGLSVEQLEELAESLLDFTVPSHLTGWLAAHASE